MKLTLTQIEQGEEEVIVRYKEETELVKEISGLVLNGSKKLLVSKDKEQKLISPADILYIESIDGYTYVYTSVDMYTIGMSLVAFINMTEDKSFFRCSKAMIINVRHIAMLKSLSGNRIDACLENGEHIIISRRYAREFREILRGDRDE